MGYGILFALRLALRRGLPPDRADAPARILARLGLPPLPAPLDPEILLAAMARDKKARSAGSSGCSARLSATGRMAGGVRR